MAVSWLLIRAQPGGTPQLCQAGHFSFLLHALYFLVDVIGFDCVKLFPNLRGVGGIRPLDIHFFKEVVFLLIADRFQDLVAWGIRGVFFQKESFIFEKFWRRKLRNRLLTHFELLL